MKEPEILVLIFVIRLNAEILGDLRQEMLFKTEVGTKKYKKEDDCCKGS